jgi:hypothetical protein
VQAFQFKIIMPIEIKELYIKAVVSDSSKQNGSQPVVIDLSNIKKELLKECVQQVLEKLKEKNER